MTSKSINAINMNFKEILENIVYIILILHIKDFKPLVPLFWKLQRNNINRF